MLEKLLKWDKDTLIYLNNLGNELYDPFWVAVTDFRIWIPLFIGIIAIIFWKYAAKVGSWILLLYTAMLTVLVVFMFIVKNTVARLRPNNDENLNQIIRIIKEPTDFSFFSGHASFSFSVVTLTVLLLRRQLPIIQVLWLYPILFSYSRIYLGVHYPVDILVGAVIGFLFAVVFHRLHKKIIVPYIV